MKEEKEKQFEEDKETVNEQTINTERSDNIQEPKNGSIDIKTNINEKNDINPGNPSALKDFKFCDYCIHKITFGKKNNYFETYENFRKRIIIVENLLENYLRINGLLKLEKRRSKLSIKNK